MSSNAPPGVVTTTGMCLLQVCTLPHRKLVNTRFHGQDYAMPCHLLGHALADEVPIIALIDIFVLVCLQPVDTWSSDMRHSQP